MTQRHGLGRRLAAGWLVSCAGIVALAVSGCSGSGGGVDIGSGQPTDPAAVDFPIFYVKRTIPEETDDLRQLRDAIPQANLFKRDKASPSAPETNITERVTGTDAYDVKDVDVSFDGKKIVFAMRGPLVEDMEEDEAPFWTIWEYDIPTDVLRRVIQSDNVAADGNDVSPHYLADGRIVFSSTRQRQSKAALSDEGKPQFEAQNEDRSEPAFVLHVMTADGSDIRQISFNQSHDRDPMLLSNGRIVWSRWDNTPGKSGMHLYWSNPDGTQLELLYGANSHDQGDEGEEPAEFIQPREMPDGRILTLARTFTDADFGGNLLLIDTARYVENYQPLAANAGLNGPAERVATPNDVRTVPGPSPDGRFNSGFPLWDGTNRILVSWTQCRLLDETQEPAAIVACTPERLAQPDAVAAPSIYSVWMFDPAKNTLLPVMTPTEDVMITDVVAAQPRALPTVILDKIPGLDLDNTLVNQIAGVLDIRSVYDFDGVDTTQPNIAAVADPARFTAAQRSARFIRIEKAVSIPDDDVVDLSGDAFGATNYMREILGYAPVEPDGSVRMKVPANVAFQISVLDRNGRRISPLHNSWLQVRPGEVLACTGCHQPATEANPRSHGRSGVYAPAYAGATAAGQKFANTNGAFLPDAGETMAQARARVSCTSDLPRCSSMIPTMDVVFEDVWTDPAVRAPDPDLIYSYTDRTFTTALPTATECLDKTKWKSNCRIIINYPQHIQPLWSKSRVVRDMAGIQLADHTCTQGGCHSRVDAMGNVMVPAGQLELTDEASDEVPLQPRSYRDLLFVDNRQKVEDGALIDDVTQGVDPDTGDVIFIGTPVGPYFNAGDARGAISARVLGRFTPGSGNRHAGMMSPAELRLVSEWLDIGAQFFNNPFDPAVPVN